MVVGYSSEFFDKPDAPEFGPMYRWLADNAVTRLNVKAAVEVRNAIIAWLREAGA